MRRTVGTALPASTTSAKASVARHAATIKQAIRYARSRTTARQDDEYTRRAAKSVLSSHRCRAVEIVTALLLDLARRGSLEDAESIGLHFAAIARAEYASAHPGELGAQMSLAEAHQLEERTEGATDEAEAALAHDPKNKAKQLRYLTAAAEHEAARRVLNDVVRREHLKD